MSRANDVPQCKIISQKSTKKDAKTTEIDVVFRFVRATYDESGMDFFENALCRLIRKIAKEAGTGATRVSATMINHRSQVYYAGVMDVKLDELVPSDVGFHFGEMDFICRCFPDPMSLRITLTGSERTPSAKDKAPAEKEGIDRFYTVKMERRDPALMYHNHTVFRTNFMLSEVEKSGQSAIELLGNVLVAIKNKKLAEVESAKVCFGLEDTKKTVKEVVYFKPAGDVSDNDLRQLAFRFAAHPDGALDGELVFIITIQPTFPSGYRQPESRGAPSKLDSSKHDPEVSFTVEKETECQGIDGNPKATVFRTVFTMKNASASRTVLSERLGHWLVAFKNKNLASAGDGKVRCALENASKSAKAVMWFKQTSAVTEDDLTTLAERFLTDLKRSVKGEMVFTVTVMPK